MQACQNNGIHVVGRQNNGIHMQGRQNNGIPVQGSQNNGISMQVVRTTVAHCRFIRKTVVPLTVVTGNHGRHSKDRHRASHSLPRGTIKLCALSIAEDAGGRGQTGSPSSTSNEELHSK
jgi:hypothetical protein